MYKFKMVMVSDEETGIVLNTFFDLGWEFVSCNPVLEGQYQCLCYVIKKRK